MRRSFSQQQDAASGLGSPASPGARPSGGLPALYACDRCGGLDPCHMVALMSIWYAAPAGVAASGGYFYLCPACYRRLVVPHEPLILQRLAQDHPHQRRPQL